MTPSPISIVPDHAPKYVVGPVATLLVLLASLFCSYTVHHCGRSLGHAEGLLEQTQAAASAAHRERQDWFELGQKFGRAQRCEAHPPCKCAKSPTCPD